MKTIYTPALVVAFLFGMTGLLNTACVSVTARADKVFASRHSLAKIKESYSKIPLSFVANYGHASKNVKFTARGSGYNLALGPTSFTLAVADARKHDRQDGSVSLLQTTLLGANSAATPTGVERLLTKTNYFIGNDPRQWKTNVPSYAKVKYAAV